MLAFLHSACRDVLRAVAFITLIAGFSLVWLSLKLLRPVWASEQDIRLLTDAWFPCAMLLYGILLTTLGVITSVSASCQPLSTAPLHLFTGATFTLLPFELAAAAAVISDSGTLHELASADTTGTLTAALTWINANPGPAGAAAAVFLVLQAAAMSAGVWVALCPTGLERRTSVLLFDSETPQPPSALHVPLLGRYHHQRRGSTASTGSHLTPRSHFGAGGAGDGDNAGTSSPARLPVLVLPTTGGA